MSDVEVSVRFGWKPGGHSAVEPAGPYVFVDYFSDEIRGGGRGGLSHRFDPFLMRKNWHHFFLQNLADFATKRYFYEINFRLLVIDKSCHVI